MSAPKREAKVKKFPYVQKTPTGWRYRRRVLPAELARVIGFIEWKSEIYENEGEANAAAARLAPLHDAIIRKWKAGEPFEPGEESAAAIESRARELAAMRPDAQTEAIVDMMTQAFNAWAQAGGKGAIELRPEDRAALTALDAGGRHRPHTMPLSAAYERDKREHGGNGRAEKFIAFAVRDFKELVGDIDFFDVKRADVAAWVKAAKAKGWAPGTIKRRTVALQGIHSRLLIAYDLPASAVWRKLDYGVGANGGAADRLPFNAAHLEALDKYLPKAKARTRRQIQIMRFTGLGPKELIGLRVRDIVLDHDVPHVFVRPHEDRALKTATRARRIPLLGEALKAAREAIADAPGEFVFVKDVKPNSAQTISAECNACIRAAGIPRSPRLTAYSLRHGVADAMRAANVQEDLRKFVLGHAQKGVTPSYGAQTPLLQKIAKELTRSYQHLGQIDDSNYEPGELMPAKARRRASSATRR